MKITRPIPLTGFYLVLLLLVQMTSNHAQKPGEQPTPVKPQPEKPGGKPQTRDDTQRLKDIALQVQKALLGKKDPAQSISSYRALLTLDFRHPQKGKFTVQVTQEFATPKSIRTMIKEPKKHILRGYDGITFWQVMKGGKVVILDRREYKQDKKTIRKEYNFANQVQNLFRVDKLLGDLQRKTIAAQRKMKVIWGDGKKLEERKCLIIEGEKDRFPFYKLNLPADYKGKIRLRLCLDAETGLPVQVHAWPAIYRTPETAYLQSERIQLYNYWIEPKTGLKVPTSFRISTIDPKKGHFFTDLVVTLEELKLNLEFPKNHFGKETAQEWAKKKTIPGPR